MCVERWNCSEQIDNASLMSMFAARSFQGSRSFHSIDRRRGTERECRRDDMDAPASIRRVGARRRRMPMMKKHAPQRKASNFNHNYSIIEHDRLTSTESLPRPFAFPCRPWLCDVL